MNDYRNDMYIDIQLIKTFPRGAGIFIGLLIDAFSNGPEFGFAIGILIWFFLKIINIRGWLVRITETNFWTLVKLPMLFIFGPPFRWIIYFSLFGIYAIKGNNPEFIPFNLGIIGFDLFLILLLKK